MRWPVRLPALSESRRVQEIRRTVTGKAVVTGYGSAMCGKKNTKTISNKLLTRSKCDVL